MLESGMSQERLMRVLRDHSLIIDPAKLARLNVDQN
jgi:hypothetical protein